MVLASRIYAGIGSRDAPEEMLRRAQKVAHWLRKRNFVLRSGGATGMDSAFAAGAKTNIEVYFPTCQKKIKDCKVGQKCFCQIPEDAFEIAKKLHPAWDRLSSYVRQLHARNVQILLGNHLNEKVRFVVLWSRFDKQRGGTALGWRLAEQYNIPVVSLKQPNAAKKIMQLAE